jgi:hypothetical protein
MLDLDLIIEAHLYVARLRATTRSPYNEAKVKAQVVGTCEDAISDMVAKGASYTYRGYKITPWGGTESNSGWSANLPDGGVQPHQFLIEAVEALDAALAAWPGTALRALTRYEREISA